MLILILIDIQYLQNVVYSFEKGSNSQNHASKGSHYPQQNLPCKISHLPPLGDSTQSLNAIGKNLVGIP